MLNVILFLLAVTILFGDMTLQQRIAVENYAADTTEILSQCDGDASDIEPATLREVAETVTAVVCADDRVHESELIILVARLEHRIVYVPIVVR
jgi:hypothetical protein